MPVFLPGDNPCRQLTCGPGQECHVDRSGRAACICAPNCEPVMRQVCGTDGKTYNNQCELQRLSCMNGNSVSVRFVGVCSKYHISYVLVRPVVLYRSIVYWEFSRPVHFGGDLKVEFVGIMFTVMDGLVVSLN